MRTARLEGAGASVSGPTGLRVSTCPSAPAESIVLAVSEMFLAAVQIAGPLLVVLFLADVGLGLLTRVAPALNAFVLGFPLKILLTLLLVPFVMLALPGLVERLADDSVLSFGRLLGVG